MHVLLVRHAIAEDRAVFAATGKTDDLRPLTGEGVKKMRNTVQGLKTLLPVLDMVANSPLTRAVQTADILHDAYPSAQRHELTALAPGNRPETVAAWLREYAGNPCIALVGHEPDLGELAAWLLAGKRAGDFVIFKKGGMLLLEFDEDIGPGQALLNWALPPGVLRKLA